MDETSPQEETQTAQGERETGPLNAFKNFFTGNSNAKKEKRSSSEPPPGKRSAMEKMRDTVAEFDEDYKDGGQRLLGAFMSFVGYVGPFLLVLFVGGDLGMFFMESMGPFSAYGLAFTLESIIAGLTVAMGRAFEETASGKPNHSKTTLIILIWLCLNASSAFGLYLIITHGGHIALWSLDMWAMLVRVLAIALGDLGCSAVLMMKGRSLQKHIESIKKRASAIEALSTAQRSIEEADKNAALREQMMKATLKIQEDLSQKIGDAVSMVMESILEKMEKALKDDDDKNERGYGTRRR